MTKIKKIINYGIIISSISLIYYYRNDILKGLGLLHNPITEKDINDTLTDTLTEKDINNTLNNIEIIDNTNIKKNELQKKVEENNTEVKIPIDTKTDVKQNILGQTFNKKNIELENITESDEQSTSDLEYTDANSLDNVEIIKEFEDDWDNLTKK